MLVLKPNCECCGKDLPPNSEEARICSFECTFCTTCAEGSLENICPNCGGGFAPRPVRPLEMLLRYPALTEKVPFLVNWGKHKLWKEKYGNKPPEKR
ncbi:MAG TPA: DUF1272 domain-containing protein [Bacteroidia bacterium]|jgi:hypothetical protein|nr:DUF1272 domain-containing protein [Bacteroidia bacterium]